MVGDQLCNRLDVIGVMNFDADGEVAAGIDALTVNLRERIEN